MALVDTRYLLEWSNAPGGRRVLLLPYVDKISIDPPPAISARWTSDLGDGARPYVEHSGFRERTIIVSGNSGFDNRRGTDRYGKSVDLPGVDLFKELEEFLEEFADYGRRNWNAFTNRSSGEAPELFFHALAEGWSHALISARLGPERNRQGQSSFTIDWNLRMVTMGRVDARTVPEDPLAGEPGRSTFDLAQRDIATVRTRVRDFAAADVARGVTDSGDEVPSFIEEAVSAVDQAGAILRVADSGVLELTADLNRLRAPIDAANKVLNTVAQLRRDALTLARFPYSVMRDVVLLCQRVVDEGHALLDGIVLDRQTPDLLNQLQDIVSLYGSMVTVSTTELARVGISISAYELGDDIDALSGSSAVSSRVLMRSGQQVRLVPLRVGDTLESLAERELGDASRWQEIADLNGITDPWFLPGGGPIAAGAGSLPVPVVDGVRGPNQNSAAEDTFGVDFLVQDGDLVLVAGERLGTIQGEPLLVQALLLRLQTVLGESLLEPEVGLPLEIGEPLTKDSLAVAFAGTRAQVLREQRARAISLVKLVEADDGLFVEVAVVPALGGPRKFSIPLSSEAS